MMAFMPELWSRQAASSRRGKWAAVLALTASLLPCAPAAAQTTAEPKTEPKAEPETETEWHPSDNDAMKSHHARSLLEMGGGLAVGAIGYWLLMDRQIADWDNPRPEQRFDGTAWRFDNNSMPMNFLGHPFAGGVAYSYARANHHDQLVSFGYAFLTSFLWEFVLEFKEKVSVNDMIATPLAGVPIGEFAYKLGLYLDTHRSPSTGIDVARWLLGTGVALDRTLDGRPPPLIRSRDALGFSSKIWHEFQLGTSFDLVESQGLDSYFRNRISFFARLVTLRDYLGPKSFGRGFYHAEISDFSLGTEVSEHGVGMYSGADTVLAGYHVQDMDQGPDGPRGVAATFGTSVGYAFMLSIANRYRAFEEAIDLPDPRLKHHVPQRREQLGSAHLPGVAVDWHARAPKVEVSVSARVNPSFGGIAAPAFYDWAAANLDEKGKHVTHRQGYFYGWGPAGSVRGRLAAGPMQATGNVSYVKYDSHDGLDRHVERITVDTKASGDVLFYGASLGFRLAPLVVSAEFGVRRWRSEVEGFEREARSVHRGLNLETTF